MNPNSFVVLQSRGRTRIWEVLSVHLGTADQESLVELRPLDLSCGVTTHEGKSTGHEVMVVPLAMVEQCRILVDAVPVQDRYNELSAVLNSQAEEHRQQMAAITKALAPVGYSQRADLMTFLDNLTTAYVERCKEAELLRIWVEGAINRPGTTASAIGHATTEEELWEAIRNLKDVLSRPSTPKLASPPGKHRFVPQEALDNDRVVDGDDDRGSIP